MDDRPLEIYRQRYETWRHLDRVRYQIVQVASAALAAFAVFLQASNSVVHPVALFLLGVAFLMLWKVLAKVNDGIVANGNVLSEFGQQVGDQSIPQVSDRKSSIFYSMEWLFCLGGASALGFGIVLGILRSF